MPPKVMGTDTYFLYTRPCCYYLQLRHNIEYMLNSSSTKVLFTLFITILVQAFLLVLISIPQAVSAYTDFGSMPCGGSLVCNSGGDSTPAQCPSGQTMVNGSCCPNEYVVTTTTGSGKGASTTYSCVVPAPTASISQVQSTTASGQSFTVTYGRGGGGPAISCVLQRQAPGGSYTQIHSNTGGTTTGSETLSTPGTYYYRAQCYGTGGYSSWSTISHLVVGPPTSFISQSNSSTVTNQAFTVTYGRSGGDSANSCRLERQDPGGSYTQIHSNSGGTSDVGQSLGTAGTYGYRALCSGFGGSSSWSSLAHSVTVPPPTLSFTADQYTIPYNTATTLRWTSQNTTSCTAGGDWSGSKSVNGSESTGSLISPVTYYLQCYNSLNQSTSPTPVTINLEYGDGASIEVNNSIVHRGSSIIATWSTGSSIPANCQLKAGSVILESALSSTTGSLDHTITGETILTIDCENGLNTDEVTVKVLPTFQES